MARSQHVVLSHFLAGCPRQRSSPCMIERGKGRSTIKNAAASRSVYIPRYVLRKASCPPQPRAPPAIGCRRERGTPMQPAARSCQLVPDRPMDMNSQPSSRTMMLREIPANMALRSRTEEHMGAAGPERRSRELVQARWYDAPPRGRAGSPRGPARVVPRRGVREVNRCWLGRVISEHRSRSVSIGSSTSSTLISARVATGIYLGGRGVLDEHSRWVCRNRAVSSACST